MTSYKTAWTTSELESLAKALMVAYKTQTTYKEPLDMTDRILGWRMILEGELGMGEVLEGIKLHMKRSRDMPVPADINNIMNPARKDISPSEYIHAKTQWQALGYPKHCSHRDVVKAYEKQSKDKVENNQISDERLLAVARNSVKKIT